MKKTIQCYLFKGESVDVTDEHKEYKEEFVAVTIKCKECGVVIVDNVLIADVKLVQYIATDILCDECESNKMRRLHGNLEFTTERQFAEAVIKRKYGVDIKIPENDPDPWWYVAG